MAKRQPHRFGVEVEAATLPWQDLHMDIRALPKAELHLHIEGTLEPELVFALANRNNISLPWANVEELRELYNFSNLQSFLDLYYQSMTALRTRDDFFDLGLAYLARAHADGVRHAEIFFDPQAHLENGLEFEDVLGGLSDALGQAQGQYGISGGLIMCFLRDKGPQAALQMLEIAEPYVGHLLGVGLDSTEIGYPSELYSQAFDRAGELGLHRVAHAGEEGPPEYVWGALRALGAERIDHGLRSLEDEELVAHLIAQRIPLTCCPFSNVRLKAIADLAKHPLQVMLERGMLATLNSDDPAYFGGYLGDNFTHTIAALGLNDAQVVQLCHNSIAASFASPERKAELFALLAAAVE
ncbi:MAG: adenosine deaminase [Propionibacteriaceae bacterium]|nr:adenosine deaminase [Propionibacteriaceae bacterium]